MEKNKNTKEVVKKTSEKPIVKADKNNFSWEVEKFNTKISELSEEIKKIQESQNNLIEKSNNFSEIKSTLDWLSRQIDDLKNEKISLEKEKNDEIIRRKNNILWLPDVEDVKNQMWDAMRFLSTWWLKDRIIETSRIFLWWALSEEEIKELNSKKIVWKELYKYALNKFYSQYVYWTDAEKVDASDYFTAIVEALRATDNPVQNISKDIYRKLWYPLAAAWILAATPAAPAALAVWWAWAAWNMLGYDTKNKIKDGFDKHIINNDAIWEKWYEKVETLAWPVWWWIKLTRKSIWWILWWWKSWIKAWTVWVAWTAEVVWWIVWSVPWFKKVWTATDWWWKWAFNKLFS